MTRTDELLYRPDVGPATKNGSAVRRDKVAQDLDGYISLEVLQQQLTEKLRQAGLLDHLKSQLRAKLIGELKGAKVPMPIGTHFAAGSTPDILFKAIDSIIAQYLTCRQLDFTKSVFLPECGISSDAEVLSSTDVEHVLQIPTDSWIWALVQSHKRELQETRGSVSQSLLVQLVFSLASIGQRKLRDQPAQTDLNPQQVLELKLSAVDERNAELAREETELQLRMKRVEADTRRRVREELELHYQKARDMELAQIRLEERRKFQADLAKLDAEYQARETERQRRVAEKEQFLLDKARKREQELDEQLRDSRQRLLKDLENVKHREKNLQRDIELATREAKLKEEHLQSKIDSLLLNVKDLEAFKRSFNSELEQQITKFKLDFERTHQLELTHMQTMQTKLAGEKDNLAQQRLHFDTQLMQLQSQVSRVSSLEEELRSANAELTVLRRQVEQRDKTIRELGINARLGSKNQKAETLLEFEVSQLRQQLLQAERAAEKRQQEYESLLTNVVAAGGSGKPQVRAIEQELLQSRQSEQKWQSEAENLVIKLEMELNRNSELDRQLDTLRVREKELLSEISDLRLILHQTQTALKVELDRRATRDLSPIRTIIVPDFKSQDRVRLSLGQRDGYGDSGMSSKTRDSPDFDRFEVLEHNPAHSTETSEDRRQVNTDTDSFAKGSVDEPGPRQQTRVSETTKTNKLETEEGKDISLSFIAEQFAKLEQANLEIKSYSEEKLLRIVGDEQRLSSNASVRDETNSEISVGNTQDGESAQS